MKREDGRVIVCEGCGMDYHERDTTEIWTCDCGQEVCDACSDDHVCPMDAGD